MKTTPQPISTTTTSKPIETTSVDSGDYDYDYDYGDGGHTDGYDDNYDDYYEVDMTDEGFITPTPRVASARVETQAPEEEGEEDYYDYYEYYDYDDEDEDEATVTTAAPATTPESTTMYDDLETTSTGDDDGLHTLTATMRSTTTKATTTTKVTTTTEPTTTTESNLDEYDYYDYYVGPGEGEEGEIPDGEGSGSEEEVVTLVPITTTLPTTIEPFSTTTERPLSSTGEIGKLVFTVRDKIAVGPEKMAFFFWR